MHVICICVCICVYNIWLRFMRYCAYYMYTKYGYTYAIYAYICILLNIL
ncbi:pE66L [African swine fever virus]|uniref:PE66L n=1 Tax=African swine fever virus TaxID=10497 RepID=A0A8A1V755_ASF|nr:pE66L [African swine fever virus]